MDQHLFFLLVGLGLGGLYSLVGIGLVLHYRGTGVIHFALAPLAAYGLFVTNELQRSGDLVLPVVAIPDRIPLGPDLATPIVLGLGVAMSVGLGLLAEVLVFRPLADRSQLARIVASIALFVVVQQIIDLKFGFEARSANHILPTAPVTVMDNVVVPQNRLWFAGIVLAAAGALTLLVRRTRFGLALRATAENPRAASLAGLSPRSLTMITVVLTQVVLTVGLLLAAPMKGAIQGFSITLLIIPALAVALVGRLERFVTTAVAGLALGAVGSELVFLSTKPWFPQWAKSGAEDVMAFAVIAVALFVIGKSLPTRGDQDEGDLPRAWIPRVSPTAWAIAVGLMVAALTLTSGGWRFGVIASLAYALIALSLVVLVGFVGQVSMAQAALAGMAGFFLARLDLGLPYPVDLVVAAIGAALVGVLVGLPALRIRGIQLAVITIGAALALQTLVFDNPSLARDGAGIVGDPSFFGLDLAPRAGSDIARLRFGLAAAAVVAAAFFVVANVLRGSTGRRFLAVRSNERAAASLGVSVAETKLVAFALSSLLAGLGGGLLTYSRGLLTSDSFGVFAGLTLLLFAVIGGITTVEGAVVAGLLAPLGIASVVADRWLNLGRYWILVGGFLALVQIVAVPQGITGALADRRAERRRVDRAVQPAPQEVPGGQALRPIPSPTRSSPNLGNRRRLAVRRATVSFGGVVALDRVDFDAFAGEVHGLIGPNGAGKTTLTDAITGFIAAEGSIELDGTELIEASPHETARAGIVRSWQSSELFDDLDVRSNLLVATPRSRLTDVLIDAVRPGRGSTETADAWLSFFGLADLAERYPTELSHGQRKLVGVARALMLEPSVLVVDEPAAGLDPGESRDLGLALRKVAEAGVAVVLIDHDMDLVLDLCDRVTVLQSGRVIGSGPTAEIRTNPSVIAAYLGDRSTEGGAAPRPAANSAPTGTTSETPARDPLTEAAGRPEVRLRLRGLMAGHRNLQVVHDLDLELRAGEILALLGSNGAGKTTTLMTMAGVLAPLGGTVEILGRSTTGLDPVTIARSGLATVPDDRGLFRQLTVGENLRLRRHRNSSVSPEDIFELFPTIGDLQDRRAGLLSGGEQQMVAIGSALLADPKVLVIDEMSLGLAPIVVRHLMATVQNLAKDRNLAVVLVEQHVTAALEIADRAIVLSQGEVVASGSASTLAADIDGLEASYLGGHRPTGPHPAPVPTPGRRPQGVSR